MHSPSNAQCVSATQGKYCLLPWKAVSSVCRWMPSSRWRPRAAGVPPIAAVHLQWTQAASVAPRMVSANQAAGDSHPDRQRSNKPAGEHCGLGGESRGAIWCWSLGSNAFCQGCTAIHKCCCALWIELTQRSMTKTSNRRVSKLQSVHADLARCSLLVELHTCYIPSVVTP